MSLEWARARLLQHCEELRRLCDAQAAARAQLRSMQRQNRRRAVVAALKPDLAQRVAPDVSETGKVLQFAQPGRRRP
jgi:hypothetical protein